MLDSRFVSFCSRPILERRSLASTLSFSAYCSNVTNLSRHRSDSVIRKFSRRDSRPIFVSRSSRASTNADARFRIDSWMCCSAIVSRGGVRTVPNELMRFSSDGGFILSVSTASNAWMMRVECHHSGGLIMSATAVDAAPRFAWILHTGRNRPAGNASLNSLEAPTHRRQNQNRCALRTRRARDSPGDAVIGVVVGLEGCEQLLAVTVALLLDRDDARRRRRTV